MADQDFKINIRATADIGAIKLTEQQLTALQKAASEGNKQAISALNQLSAAQKAASSGGAGIAAGFLGGAAIGAVSALVGIAANEWRKLNAELDKQIENAIKNAEVRRKEIDSILEITDAEIDERRLGLLPLKDQYNELGKEITRLRTERDLLNLPQQADEFKKLTAEINRTAREIDKVTNALQRQGEQEERNKKQREKDAEKERKEAESFAKGALETSSPQVQAALANEARARRAGIGTRESDQLMETAQSFVRGMTQSEREEYQGLSGNKDVLDAIERLRQDLVGLWR